ncbi:MAG: hypothetical protein IT378_00135 [Sandaracinaceae bacterium]|nr:hypothetical protein [Sandaracinaceae bacterium]
MTRRLVRGRPRAPLLAAAIYMCACSPPAGPTLPRDVGASHGGAGGGRADRPAAAVAAEPVEVGTIVWASFRDAGFYFRGVVVERRGETHRVVYDDGESEWVEAQAILPDSLGEGAVVNVRSAYGERFSPATVERRVGRALYVHHASGGEGWTSIAHVRFAADDHGAPARGSAPVPAPEGAEVLAEFRRQGLRFPATLTARREDGQAHVVYVDGETEWTTAVTPDDIGPGTTIHVLRRREPPEWALARVEERQGDALRVTLEDGAMAWTSALRVRVPAEPPAAAPPSTPPQAAPAAPPPTAPRTAPRTTPRRTRAPQSPAPQNPAPQNPAPQNPAPQNPAPQ